MSLQTFSDLYLDQLRDLYDAETQLTEALPKMADAASHPELVQAFRMHLDQTRGQIERLDQIFQALGEIPSGKTCEAMAGLVKEGNELIGQKDRLLGEDADRAVLDAGLIAAAQRVEHYEIASYGTVCTYAEMLGRPTDHALLGQTLEEEKQTDGMLTQLAKQVVNPHAAAA